MNVKGNACSHTPHDHILRAGVDSRCERCRNPMGVRMAWETLVERIKWPRIKTRFVGRICYDGSTQRFPGDYSVRVSA